MVKAPAGALRAKSDIAAPATRSARSRRPRKRIGKPPFLDGAKLAKLHGADPVSWALGHAAVHGRFADGDLAAILAHRASATSGPARQAGETASLQDGTAAWQGFGQ